MTQGPKTRKSFDISGATAQPTPPTEAPLLSWIVESGPEEQHYRVDLNALLPQERNDVQIVSLIHRKRAPSIRDLARPIRNHWHMILSAMAPSIRKWTKDRASRSTFEELTKLKWLFHFLDDQASLHSEIIGDGSLESLSEEQGVKFAEWLRHQKSLKSTRMGAIYSSVARFIKDAMRTSVWRPSPFSMQKATIDREEYSEKQYLALVRMSKKVIAQFKKDRAKVKQIFRSVQRDDPTARKRPFDVGNKFRKSYQIRDAILAARIALSRSESPSGPGLFPFTETFLAPTVDLVAAEILLVIARSGANEQPILDLPPGQGLMAGKWLRPNPFGLDYRIIMGLKNRNGMKKNDPKPIPMPFRAKPEFYPVKVVRYKELLGAWCRRVIQNSNPKPTLKTPSGIAAIASSKSMWIYWNEGKWQHLNGQNVQGIINRLIAREAQSTPDLLDEDGKPISYNAKLLRDAYLRYVAHKSAMDIKIAQGELGHSEDSRTIYDYLRRKWVKTYAHDGLRQYQSASHAILDSDETVLQPAMIRKMQTPESREALTHNHSKLVKVRSGFCCEDPTAPPKGIYRSKHSGDVCPAVRCYDCDMARSFRSGLPEMGKSILNLRSRRDKSSAHLWDGSAADRELRNLEDVFARYSAEDQTSAMREAETLDVPLLFYRPAR